MGDLAQRCKYASSSLRAVVVFVTPGIAMKKKNDFHAVSSVSPWSSLPVLFWIYFEAVLTSFKKF